MDISKLNDRLEIDAYKYADQFPSADNTIKSILQNAYLSGEHKVADKVVDWYMNDKDNKTTNMDFEKIEVDVAKELFVKSCDISCGSEECAELSILAANTFIGELKKYIKKNEK